MKLRLVKPAQGLVWVRQGLLLGKRAGLDLLQLRDVVMTASGAGPQVLGAAHQYRTRRYRESVTPQAALRLAVKDLELGVALAAEVARDLDADRYGSAESPSGDSDED